MTNAHSSQMRFHPKWAFITNPRSPVTDPGPTPQNSGIAQTRPVRARLGIARLFENRSELKTERRQTEKKARLGRETSRKSFKNSVNSLFMCV
jgi:hypothetical protein